MTSSPALILIIFLSTFTEKFTEMFIGKRFNLIRNYLIIIRNLKYLLPHRIIKDEMLF